MLNQYTISNPCKSIFFTLKKAGPSQHEYNTIAPGRMQILFGKKFSVLSAGKSAPSPGFSLIYTLYRAETDRSPGSRSPGISLEKGNGPALRDPSGNPSQQRRERRGLYRSVCRPQLFRIELLSRRTSCRPVSRMDSSHISIKKARFPRTADPVTQKESFFCFLAFPVSVFPPQSSMIGCSYSSSRSFFRCFRRVSSKVSTVLASYWWMMPGIPPARSSP